MASSVYGMVESQTSIMSSKNWVESGQRPRREGRHRPPDAGPADDGHRSRRPAHRHGGREELTPRSDTPRAPGISHDLPGARTAGAQRAGGSYLLAPMACWFVGWLNFRLCVPPALMWFMPYLLLPTRMTVLSNPLTNQ